MLPEPLYSVYHTTVNGIHFKQINILLTHKACVYDLVIIIKEICSLFNPNCGHENSCNFSNAFSRPSTSIASFTCPLLPFPIGRQNMSDEGFRRCQYFRAIGTSEGKLIGWDTADILSLIFGESECFQHCAHTVVIFSMIIVIRISAHGRDSTGLGV